jgi:hypothetical protein
MANLYVTEIPNVPKTIEMPMPQPRKVPDIRVQAPTTKVNMSEETAKLQKAPLPGGFAKGMDLAASAAGKGTMAMGKAIGEGGAAIAKTMAHASYLLEQMADKALDTQDKLAGVRAHENRTMISEMEAADAAKHGWTPQQQLEHHGDYVEKLRALNSGLGGRPVTQDIIASQDQGYAVSSGYRLQKNAFQKTIDDGIALVNQKVDLALDTKSPENLAIARQALDAGHAIGQFNDAKYNELNQKLDVAAKMGFVEEKALNADSAAWVKGEAEKQQRGEKNDLFTKNDTPAMWNHADDLATKTIVDGQRANAEALQGTLITNPTKVTQEELLRQRDEGKISNDQYEALETRRLNVPIPYNEEKAGDAYYLANTYDPDTDKDAKGRHSMAEYDRRAKFIMQNVPKEDQPELLNVLKERWTKGLDKDFSAQDAEKTLTLEILENTWKQGYLIDPATKKPMPSGYDKGKITDEAEYNSSMARRVELQRKIEIYAKNHPEFAPNELREYAWDQMKNIVHGNVSAETAGVGGVKVAESFPTYYSSIAMPGAPVIRGEDKTPPAPVTEAQKKAERDAAKAGLPPPAPVLPTGPGAPVAITVYDRENSTFREAPLPPSKELLSIVNEEAKIYDVLLKSNEASLRGKLGIIEGDALDPSIKEGIVREATKVAKEKKITLEQAGDLVIRDLSEKAKADAVKIQDAMKAAENPTAFTTPTGFFKDKLAGQEATFVAAAQRYGLDPTLLMAIAAHETGRGTSDMVKNRNNPGGLYNSDTDEYMSFDTIEAGIDKMASNLKRNYIDKGLTSIEQIQAKYAPVGAANDPKKLNDQWTAGVTSFQKQLQAGGASKQVVQEAGTINKVSQEKIATLEPQVQQRAVKFMTLAEKWAAENGYEVRVTEGYRTPERQEELYAQGRTAPGPRVTNARAGQSHHQSKKAFDVVITKNGKEVDKKEVWAQLGALGKAAGLAWGGDFKSIYDPNHFEFMG